MTNYFRITAYQPKKNICTVFDSNGRFEKLWQFSASLIQKDFKIIEVRNKKTFTDGNTPKISPDTKHILLRACGTGQPKKKNDALNVNGKFYIAQ